MILRNLRIRTWLALCLVTFPLAMTIALWVREWDDIKSTVSSSVKFILRGHF